VRILFPVKPVKIRALFSDIGGVLGTNGWDTALRQKVTARCGVDPVQAEALHHLMFDSYERGYISFNTYLQKVFFATDRPFRLEEVRDFILNESTPWQENIEFFRRIKRNNSLKLGLISNEGEGLAEYRARRFGLRDLADFTIFSHFVHLRKPDPEIWQLALKLVQVEPAETVYVDDREMFALAAQELGFAAIHHVSLPETQKCLVAFGIS